MFNRTGDTTDEITIDFSYTTHIHEDHVFGIQRLKNAGYAIDEAYRPPGARAKRDVKGGVKSTVLDNYYAALSDHGIEPDDIQEVTTGDEILREGDVALTAISPPATSESIEFDHPETGESCEYGCEKANPNSAACQYDGPHDSYLFMGDIENKPDHDAEAWLVKQHQEDEINLDADVLVAGHHGSNNTTSRLLLETVDQDWTMISADSTYHPATETLRDLQAANDSGLCVSGINCRTAFTDGLPPTPTNPAAPTQPWRIDQEKHASTWSEIVGQERTKNEKLREDKKELEEENREQAETIEDQQQAIEEKDEGIEAFRAESERSIVTGVRDRLASAIGRTEPSHQDDAATPIEDTDTSIRPSDTSNEWNYASPENVEVSKGKVGGNAEEDVSANTRADTSINTAESDDVRSKQDDTDEHLGNGSSV